MNIIFFDLETTGTSTTKDRIVSLSAFKVDEKYNLIEGSQKDLLVNPGIPIPVGASDVHGITDDMVKDKPSFKQYAQGIHQYFSGCALAGYNIKSFDVPILSEELGRCELLFPQSDVKIIDSFNIFRIKEKRDLSSALKFYTGETMEGAHDANNDNIATLKIFMGQMNHYPELAEMDVAKLHEFCNDGKTFLDLAGKIGVNEKGEAYYTFGKDVGKTLKSSPGFGEWMLKNDFPTNTKNIIRAIIYG